MDLLKGIVGKIVAGLVGLAVIAGGISWYEMAPATRKALVSARGGFSVGWGSYCSCRGRAFSLLGGLPGLKAIGQGALLVAGYTAAEAIALAWLFHWQLHGATAIISLSLPCCWPRRIIC